MSILLVRGEHLLRFRKSRFRLAMKVSERIGLNVQAESIEH